MLECYFVVATFLIAGTYADGETTTPRVPSPLEDFSNIHYELSTFVKKEFDGVYKAFGLTDDEISSLMSNVISENSNSTLTLLTPWDSKGEYQLQCHVPVGPGINVTEIFTLNNPTNDTWAVPKRITITYAVEGNKLISTWDDTVGKNTLMDIWEFSADQVTETLESGDAKATRIWKAKKTPAGNPAKPTNG